jgi:ribonuclease HI
MNEPQALTIYTDGAARGNPGPAAYAYVIQRKGAPPIEDKGTLGHTTNNVAEYAALVRALEHAARLGARRLNIHSDSELLVKQMNGEYQVRNDDLRALFRQARDLVRQFDNVAISHVRREQNRRADRLCNEALDGASRRPRSAGSDTPLKKQGAVSQRQQSVSDEAILCLQAAAREWARGNPNQPPPEQVWEQLWTILEEGGVLRPARSRIS